MAVVRLAYHLCDISRQQMQECKMPDRDVATIKDLIYYQYAKIIAKRSMHAPDGKQAKNSHYSFTSSFLLKIL